jgi:hypothetical protein
MVHGCQHVTVGIARFAQKTVKGKLHIVGHQFTAIERWFVVPFDPFAEMENVGGIVWCFPTFS